jgi:hypothetical protein
MSLKYWFGVVYKDGSTFDQNEEDKSTVDPLRSSYFDVRLEDVVVFYIHDDESAYSVNLETGEFAVDGHHFRMHDDGEVSGRLELVFHRRHRHDFNGTTEIGHAVVYRIGWVCPETNVTRIMEID